MHEIDVRFLFTYLFNYLIIYLFIYKLRQEAWITHRESSTTWSRKKNNNNNIFNTTNKNDNTLEKTKKRNGNSKTELGRTSIKNQQHIRSSKWPTSTGT